jgi:RNA polymerase sigma-70 factor (ECF subfamily)
VACPKITGPWSAVSFDLTAERMLWMTADFGTFYEANVDRARRLAWRLVGGDDAAAEDVVQDAFVKAYRGLGKFRGDARPESWFFRIVVNEAHNYRRWRGVREIFGSVPADESPDARTPVDPMLRSHISDALRQLSRGQREAFVLVHLEGFTVRETAEIQGSSEGTIKKHLHRGLAKLRTVLSASGEEVFE